MFWREFPRFYELKDLVADPTSSAAAFPDLEILLGQPHARDVFGRWEEQFQRLGLTPWRALTAEARPYLNRRHPGRGWQQLFDILGQARAYNYLRDEQSWMNMRFIPRAARSTPDIEGRLGCVKMLCEVKTINVSEQEINARRGQGARKVASKLGDGFLRKLSADIAKATDQMRAFDSLGEARHHVFVIVRFDDWVGVYADEYWRQIDRHLFENDPGIEVFMEDDAFRSPGISVPASRGCRSVNSLKA